MKEIIRINSAHDQIPIYATLFYNENSTKGIVQIMHGMAEHRHRYDWFAEELLKAGYVVLVCDHRGHGDSAETLGYFADQNGWFVNIDDLQAMAQAIKKRFDLPLILFGHSMGSLCARSFLKRYEGIVNKVVLSGSPCRNKLLPVALPLAKTIAATKGKKHPSLLMNELSFGAFNKDVHEPETEFDWLSVNRDNVESYVADERCGYVFTAQGFVDLLLGMRDVYGLKGWSVQRPDIPIKFFSGSLDPCMGKEKGLQEAAAILRKQGYHNVDIEIFDGLRHEILNEKERRKVAERILAFIAC